MVGSTNSAASSIAEDLKQKDNVYWKDQFSQLSKKYNEVLDKQNAVERLVEEAHALAPKSYHSAPPASRPPNREHGKPQSAVLMLSDQHIGAVVKPGQTLTFGEYDFPMFLARQKYLEESVISIVGNHINTEVPELVIAMLGDALDGALQHSAECGQSSPMFNQCYSGAHATAQLLRNLAPHFPKIRVYSCVGNHPRYQNQHKMPTKNRYSNFDQFFYAMVRMLVRDISTITWDLNTQPYQVFDVNGFSFFAGHGDSLRGGDKALGIPAHAVGRTVSTTSQMFTKFGKAAPNYYLFGHLHRNISLPHATGDVIINGGFPGIDGFGLSEMFTPADPMQRFFLVHPQYGKTAAWDISLKFARPDSKNPAYDVPVNFEVE